MKANFLPLAWVSWFALPLALCAQPAARPLTPVNATVSEVTDNRTTGSFKSECKIELKFTGDAAADAASVRQVHLKKAVDELGRDLIPADDADSFHAGLGSLGSGRSGVLKTELTLRNPSRNATVIKVIEGDVELFSPTKANGGILVIQDILKHPAEPVQNDTLKKFGIQLMYLTKESYEAKKRELEQQDKSGGAVGQAFADLFKGMFSGMMSSSSGNSLTFFVKDPDKRVLGLECLDATGKPLKRNGSWSSNEMVNQQFENPPPVDTQLLIHLATPEAIQLVPFKIENIPLP